jgi:ZIP family zinc transporter
VDQVVQSLAWTSVLVAGELASLAGGLMAVVGALPLLFIRVASQRLSNVTLGFAAGLMLSTTAFRLVQPGIEEAGSDAYGALVRLARTLLGGVLGYSSTS